MKFKSLSVVVAGLLGIVLLACNTTINEAPLTGPQTFPGSFTTESYKHPDSGVWHLDTDSGTALFVRNGNKFDITLTIPSPVGTRTVWLDVYAVGIREARIPFKADGSGVAVMNEKGIEYEGAAIELLKKVDSLKPNYPRTRAGVLDLYAGWLLVADRRAAGFPAQCPVGLGTNEVVGRVLQLVAASGQSVANAAKTWSLGMAKDSVAVVALAQLKAKQLSSADSAVLFPPPLVRIDSAVGLETAELVAGGGESWLHGQFGFAKGLDSTRVLIVDADGKPADSLFVWRGAKPALGLPTWNLSELSLRAKPGTAVGSYQVVMMGRDGDGESASTRFGFKVVAPALARLLVPGIPADLALVEDSALTVVLKLKAWQADSVSLEVRSREPALLASFTQRIKPNNDSTVVFLMAAMPDAHGAGILSLVVRDTLDSVKATIAITVVARNDAPTFTVVQPTLTLVAVGSLVTPQWATHISAGPVDEKSQAVSFEVQTLSGGELFSEPVAVDGAGTLFVKSKTNKSGLAKFQVRAHDNGDSTGANGNVSPWVALQITLNAPPALTLPNRDTAVWENTTTDLALVSLYDLETSVGNLAFAVRCSDTALLPADSIGIFAHGATRKISLHPVAGKWGACILRLELRDSSFGVFRDSIRVTVRHVNRAPALTAPPVVYASALGYGVAAKVGFGYSGSMGIGDTGQKLTYSISLRDAADAALFTAAPSVDSQKLAFVPVVPGSDTVWLRLRAKDNGGTEHGGVDTASVDIQLVFTDTVIDARDGRVYHFRRIGNQTWMTENSRFTPASGQKWANGDSTLGQLYASSADMYTGSYCADLPSEGPKSVSCYNIVFQSVCPSGWRLPSPADWDTLVKRASAGVGLEQGLLKLFAKDGSWWLLGYDSINPGARVASRATDELGFHLRAYGGMGGMKNLAGKPMEYPWVWYGMADPMGQGMFQFVRFSPFEFHAWQQQGPVGPGDLVYGGLTRCIRN